MEDIQYSLLFNLHKPPARFCAKVDFPALSSPSMAILISLSVPRKTPTRNRDYVRLATHLPPGPQVKRKISHDGEKLGRSLNIQIGGLINKQD